MGHGAFVDRIGLMTPRIQAGQQEIEGHEMPRPVSG